MKKIFLSVFAALFIAGIALQAEDQKKDVKEKKEEKSKEKKSESNETKERRQGKVRSVQGVGIDAPFAN